jgi:glyoxylase-like metal-dependent hydrolase (beta-lactamase superfamily II)
MKSKTVIITSALTGIGRATAVIVVAGFLSVSMVGPISALADAPQHHDQVPGFYRLKVGDLEVTSLYDGGAQFDTNWLRGTQAVMADIGNTLQKRPHFLDVTDWGFLVNTGKRLILVDAGAGEWWGGGALGRLGTNLHRAGYTPEQVDLVLLTHMHSDHIGGLSTRDGKRVFPNADVYVAKAENDFWLSPEIAAKAPKEAQEFFQSAKAISAPYIKAGKWHTFSGSDEIAEGIKTVPLPGHTPGHTGYEFSSKGQKILFWGDIIHALSAQIKHPEVSVVFDINGDAAAATRESLMPVLAEEGALIAGGHLPFPGLGRLHKEESGYSWTPVTFTDRWSEQSPSLQK